MISGGGTGGHIFPALAIAEAIRTLRPDTDFQFVGALGKMEMDRIPQAGYPIEGLWISGLHRQKPLRNLNFPFKVLSSLWRSRQLIRQFQPDVVVGTGGFASGPLLEVASRMGIPTLIQEQNAYAGLTNKLLAKRVDRICVAYPNMERYFPAEKLVLAGNPVREAFLTGAQDPVAARQHYHLAMDKPTVLLTGGSLGASQLNRVIAAAHETFATHSEVQLLWQCGQLYIDQYRDSQLAQLPNVELRAFLDRMDLAYAAADIIICRAGALTIAELCLLGKAAILVPSPNVAEDHQTKNARALADRKAALLVPDKEAVERLVPTAIQLIYETERQQKLAAAAAQMAQRGAAERIATEVIQLASQPTTQPIES